MPEFENYELLTDMLGWLDSSVQYKFVTRFATKNRDGNRESFHKEYTYKSNYNNIDMLTSIKRSFDSYILIEGAKGSDIYIQIRSQNMIMLQNVLGQMVSLVFDERFWAIKNKMLVLKGKPAPIYIQQLPMSKWLSFELIVMEYNGQFDKGIRIIPSDESKYIDVRIDSFMGFVYTINTFSMYSASVAHINYLQRPPFGTNMITFDNSSNDYSNRVVADVSGKNGRFVDAKPQKSFFDKVDKLG